MDVPRLVRTHVTTNELAPPKELVQSVNDGTTPLLEVVKALGEYLTSTEDDIRLKGLTFLSNLVQIISSGRFNRQTTQTLTRFYLSKLDDFDSLPPTLQALTVLSKLPTFDDNAAVEVYKGIVENVNMKSYAQATRHLIYMLFDSLLATHRKALKDMGAEFLNSYTKMVDGEKDPRNLMLLFSMDRVILLEFDVAPMIEDYFDITFCYFPITFKPPPNDPYGITADDLKLALRNCMAASPHFAKMALPLFLEKFSTATGQSMKDLMSSMAACFPIYGGAAVGERGKELWEGIKTEILYSSDTTIEAAALSALESLMRTIYPSQQDPPIGLAQDIIKEMLEILQEPEKSQGIAATKSLAALIRGSPSAGPYALSQALPQLFRQFNRPPLPSHRPPILSAISSLLLACESVYAAPASKRHQSSERSLEPFREALMDTLREGLRTEGLKVPAIKSCVSLVEIPGFWARDEVEEVVKGMDNVLLEDRDPENRSTVISALTTISQSYSSTIETTTLPLLFHNLPDRAPGLSAQSEREKYRSILSSLSELCIQPSLFETLVIRILNKLDVLASRPPSAAPGDDAMDGSSDQSGDQECDVAYAHDLLGCLSGVIDKKLDAKHVDVSKYFDKIVPRLFGLTVPAAATKSEGGVFADRRLIALVGRVTEKLGWELDEDRRARHVSAVYEAFEKGNFGAVTDASNRSATAMPTSSPLRANAPASEQNLIPLYTSTITTLTPTLPVPFSSPLAFLSSRIHWTIHVARDAYHVRWALDMITALVNKRAEREMVGEGLEGVMEGVWVKEVVDTANELEVRKRGLLVYLHIIKALALIRHPLACSTVLRVTDVLKLYSFDPIFVAEAAKGFAVLGEGKGKGRKRGWTLTAKLLWAQKIWAVVWERLREGDVDAKGRDRLVYLSAFASLVPVIPPALAISDLPRILPFLLRSLSRPDPSQRTNVITTVISILETQNMSTEVDTLLHQNAVSLVDNLLKSALPDSTGERETSGRTRTSALRCLAKISEAIRFDTLRNSKSQVVKELGKALDDPLRAVRWEAVECRAAWYRYGNAV